MKISFILLLKLLKEIMVLRFLFLLFMLQKALCITYLVLKPLNRMVELKERINTYWMLVKPFYINPNYLSHVVFLINRVTTPLLQNQSPYQLLHDNMSVFKVFGSLWYASNIQSNRTKLDPKGIKVVFLGIQVRCERLCFVWSNL